MVVAFTCAFAIMATGGCYQKVVRTKQGDVTTQVSEPNFNEKQGPFDELMWGPVPQGQDPDAYYRKKKQLAN